MDKVPNDTKHEIEKLLPRSFLLDLGTYVQTCAHIELAACSLSLALEEVLPAAPEWFQKFSERRKKTPNDLVKDLKRGTASADRYGFKAELEALCDWIRKYVGNRHIAVHGAFVGSPTGFLRVDYIHKEKRDGTNYYRHERTAITRQLVNEALKDADNIFLILMEMLEKIETGLSRDVYNAAIPIVAHPEESA